MDNQHRKIALIVGAGPAGLTAAKEFLDHSEIRPVVAEQSDRIGGISCTICYKGNRMDAGGHRFFSKSDRVINFWNDILPMQGHPSLDDKLLSRNVPLQDGGPDPEQQNDVMLARGRVSRIFYRRRFFDYPVRLKWQTLANMGFMQTVRVMFGYLHSLLFKRKEDSLEDFYINRFGKPLYSMFFEDYTEKVWGVHPSKLGADWGNQRVKGLSVFAILRDMLSKVFRVKKQQHVETSLIESFIYPKFGPGQLWETVAGKVRQAGGDVVMNAKVSAIHVSGNRVDYAELTHADGQVERVCCDYLLSSMPLKELLPALQGIEVPSDVMRIATELPYRDFIIVGLLVKKLKIKNETHLKTFRNRVPDTWIYIQERDVRMGRLQIFNNWSPYLLDDYENTVWIGLEYFASEGDELWNMDKQAFIEMAIREAEHVGIIDSVDVIDSTQEKIRKAYPSYFGSYYELQKVKDFLDKIENLYCIGRNGQHRYNNMDHSMLTAMMAVDNITKGIADKEAVWAVNAEDEYHESK